MWEGGFGKTSNLAETTRARSSRLALWEGGLRRRSNLIDMPELALRIAAAILPSFPFVGGSAGGQGLLSFARYTSGIEVSFGVSEEGA